MFFPVVITVLVVGVALIVSLVVNVIQRHPIDEKALRLYHLSKLNISVNDIVSHIDYDPWLMRVVEITNDGFIVCSWENSDGKLYSHSFSPFAIKAPMKIGGPLL